MYCGQCASKLTEDAKFCGVCGWMVKKNLKNKSQHFSTSPLKTYKI